MSRHPYAFTRNEIRREAGFDARADGNVYLVPVNLDTQPVQTTATISPVDMEDGEPVLMLIQDETDEGIDAA